MYIVTSKIYHALVVSVSWTKNNLSNMLWLFLRSIDIKGLVLSNKFSLIIKPQLMLF